MKYKVWHRERKKWIHDIEDIFISPDGEVIEKYEAAYETVCKDITREVDVVWITDEFDRFEGVKENESSSHM